MKSIIILCISLLILCSCAAGHNPFTVSNTGHKVEIETKTSNLWAELVAVQDDELIILLSKEVRMGKSNTKSKLAKINFKHINSISISDLQYKGSDRVLLYQFLPAAVLGLTGVAYTGGLALAAGGIFMIPGLITILIYDSSTPDPVEWNSDIAKENIYDFRIYSRINHKLTEEQLKELLDYYKQKEIVVLK